MAVRTYQQLIAWQRAIDLVQQIYRVTKKFPKDEFYALTSQIRRASVSIPSNIAEGQGRRNTDDFCRFLRIAQGSLQELETQLIIAEQLGYLDNISLDKLLDLSAEVGRLICGLAKSLNKSLATSN